MVVTKTKKGRNSGLFPEKNSSATGIPVRGLGMEAYEEFSKEGEEAEGSLFASRNRNYRDFVLVRALSTCSYSIIHYVEIEGQVQQLEVRYIHNSFEPEIVRRTQKLASEGLYVHLEAISAEEYCRFEKIARRHLRKIMTIGKEKLKANTVILNGFS